MGKSRYERLQQLNSHIRVEGASRIEDLSKQFDVSTATIRRDVKELERRGFVVQTVGGGIMYSGGVHLNSIDPASDSITQFEQKLRIGRYASSLVNAEDEILIGPGTTTLIVGKSLADIHDREFRIITNNLELALITGQNRNIHTVLIGGELSGTGTTGFDGPRDFFTHCHSGHRLFVSCDGVDIVHGLTSFSTAYLGMLQKMFAASIDITVLVDSSKLGVARFNSIAPVSRVNRLVTDKDADPELCGGLRDLGIEVVQV